MSAVDPVAWLVVTLPLGVCRATQLAMYDKVFEKPRNLFRRLGEYPRFSIACPWCTSTQLALIVVTLLAWDFTRNVTAWILMGLAMSLVAVLVDRLIDRSTYLADEPLDALRERGKDPDRRADVPDEVRAILDRGE